MSSTFQRKEVKYIATAEQAERFARLVSGHLQPDKYGRCYIKSTYFDTPDLLLASRSMSKPTYKEKLRVRQYGGTNGEFKSWDAKDASVFVELKKKFKGITYKRRVEISGVSASALINGTNVSELAETCGIKEFTPKQIMSEISSMAKRYEGIKPAMDVSYARIAYAPVNEIEDADIRMTIDDDLRCALPNEAGERLIDADKRIIEIKVPGAYPLWLTEALSVAGLFPQSFSKYALSSQKIIENRNANNTSEQSASVNTEPSTFSRHFEQPTQQRLVA